MSLHSDLQKVKIPHSCTNCCRKCGFCTSACSEFYPDNMPRFMDYTVDYLRKTTAPSKEHKLKRHVIHDGKSYNDGITTLDAYYVMLINSVLSEIRKGKKDYAFHLEQIKEIMRFEPRITVRYIPDAGAYEIRIEK